MTPAAAVLWIFSVVTMLDGQSVSSDFLMGEQDCKKAMQVVMRDLGAARINDTVVSCTPPQVR